MNIDVVLLPRELKPEHLRNKSVVVFDVLRATTTMTAALDSGVKEIRIFQDLDSALAAKRICDVPNVLCGERNALKPPGFDLGNSPGIFGREVHRDKIMLMTTTNGTKAILAASEASSVFIGALVNADAAAGALLYAGRDATLLCSGTEGFVCTEDLLGAGAVIEALQRQTKIQLNSDVAWMAAHLFRAERDNLLEALRASRGGRNVTRAGLEPDIEFCAKLNSINVVGIAEGQPPVVRRWH